MTRIILGIILLIEVAALANRGGGPLLSHLALTLATFCIIGICYFKQIRLHPPSGRPILSFAGFLLFFILSLVISLTPNFGLAEFLLFTNTGLLLFILASIEISEKDIQWFSIALLGLATIDTLIGYFVYTQAPFPRFTGTFIDLAQPHTAFGNDYANFLLLVLPLAFFQLFKKHQRITTTFVTASAASILLSGFILSFSRAAWISFFIILILTATWFFLRKEAKKFFVPPKTLAIRAGTVLIATIVLVTVLQTVRSQKFPIISFLHKASFQADEGGASITERFDFWKGALKMIGERPLFGSGSWSFKYLYPKYQPDFGTNWDHPHNMVLKIGVENGIFAMIFFILFLTTAAFTIGRFLWKESAHTVVFLMLGSLAAFGHNLLDFNFIVANFTLFMVFLGLALSLTSTNYKLQTTNFSLRVLLLISFLLFLLGLHEGLYNFSFKKGRAALAAGRLDEAIVRLETSKNLFFQRDLSLYLSDAYRQKFKASGGGNWRMKEKNILEQAARPSRSEAKQIAPSRGWATFTGTVDATLFSRLAEIYAEEKSYPKAELLITKALSLDPKNRLKYYFQRVDVFQKQGKRIERGDREKIRDLLQAYMPILRKNRHMTVLTDNPFYAGKLYDFFGMKKEREELDKIWFEELIKFTTKYGKVQKPLL